MPEFVADRKAHIYKLGGEKIDSVTDVLGDLGIIETEWFTEDSCARGVAVHTACHFWDEGDLVWESLAPIEDALQQPIRAYVKAWIRFRRETGFIPTVIEKPIYHPLYHYAGTPDRLGTFPNQKGEALLDLKTGKAAAWTGLQTGAYNEALGPAKIGWRRRYAVELMDNADFRLVPFTDLSDGKTFLSMYITHRWGKKHGQFNRSEY